MAQLLSQWDAFLMAMPLDDWLDMENCNCEGRCTCDEKEGSHDSR